MLADWSRLPLVKRFTTAPHVSHRDGLTTGMFVERLPLGGSA